MWFGKRRALPVVEVETIPHEIWHHILLYAGIKAAASMRLVSSTMNQISVDDFLWKQFAIRFQYEKARSPLRTELNEITFPSGVTPSWFEYCKMLMSSKYDNLRLLPNYLPRARAKGVVKDHFAWRYLHR